MALPEHVELSGGVVTWATTSRASGRTVNAGLIGKQRFYVEVVTSDSRYCLWDGDGYGDAIEMAEKTRLSLGIAEAVHDTVVRAAE